MKKDGTLIECNHKQIRYKLQNDTIQHIYEAVTLIESEIRTIDEYVFTIVDSYEKFRLCKSNQNVNKQIEFKKQFSFLNSTLQELVEFYYNSFLEIVRDPMSVKIRKNIVRECESIFKLIFDEYIYCRFKKRLQTFIS